MRIASLAVILACIAYIAFLGAAWYDYFLFFFLLLLVYIHGLLDGEELPTYDDDDQQFNDWKKP